MDNQNGVKSNNPAPTVEQINADGITQVRYSLINIIISTAAQMIFYYFIYYFVTYNINKWACFKCSWQTNTGHHIPRRRICRLPLKSLRTYTYKKFARPNSRYAES